MGAPALRPTPPLIVWMSFRPGYSLAGWSPPEPTSASPADYDCALKSSCRSRSFHPTAYCVLTVCVRRGGKRTEIQRLERLVWDAVYALQKAGLDKEAARLRRALEKS